MDDHDLFQQPLRLRLMGLLHARGEVGFGSAQETLAATAGNLESHCRRLEAAGCLRLVRVLARRGFEKRIRITPEGRSRFMAFLDDLASFVAQVRPSAEPSPPPGEPLKPRGVPETKG